MTPLRAILNHQGRKMTWLADQTGRSTRTIERWCAGDTRPDRLEVVGLAVILGVAASELLEAYDENILSGRT